MKCRHCQIEFHPVLHGFSVGDDKDYFFIIQAYECPACDKLNIFLINRKRGYPSSPDIQSGLDEPFLIWPRISDRPPCPPEVPPQIAADYNEACIVFPNSPIASAALSRRCLQNLLRQAAKVKPGKLFNEIQQVIKSKSLPSDLSEALDNVRNIGNFAAHPTKSKNTGEIMPIEPGEAEWNLEILEDLFDFYYVRPARTAKKKENLDKKMQEVA